MAAQPVVELPVGVIERPIDTDVRVLPRVETRGRAGDDEIVAREAEHDRDMIAVSVVVPHDELDDHVARDDAVARSRPLVCAPADVRIERVRVGHTAKREPKWTR